MRLRIGKGEKVTLGDVISSGNGRSQQGGGQDGQAGAQEPPRQGSGGGRTAGRGIVNLGGSVTMRGIVETDGDVTIVNNEG